jgi:hypothetical protein
MNIKSMNLMTTAALAGALLIAGVSVASAEQWQEHYNMGLDLPGAVGHNNGANSAPGAVPGAAGNSKDTVTKMNQEFYGSMDSEDQTYAISVCKIQYKYRTEGEKQFCLDIGK